MGQMTTPEILSPAGEWTALEAAIRAGCDAVYFGVEALNMRSAARNFSDAELPKVVERCRQSGVRAYLTLNTLVYEHELGLLDDILDQAGFAGVDAVIASDLAVIEGACHHNIPVHVSTQMSLSNSRAVARFFREYGVRRFVLARECSLEDIGRIREGLRPELGDDAGAVELEVFAHGAMCVSVSGRCFLSQFQYGKSANRGECLQPCRREYRVTNVEEDESFDLGDHYVMSPKDLCTLPFIEKLVDAGIASFKIEGRNRSPEYVSVVTRAYREVVDAYVSNHGRPGAETHLAGLKKEHLERIDRVYHRGYSSGHYLGKPIKAWTESGGSQASARKAYVGIVTNYYAKVGVAEVRVQDQTVSVGDEVLFMGPTTGVVEQTVGSMQVEHQTVVEVSKGMMVAIKTKEPVRRNDKLYVVVNQKAEIGKAEIGKAEVGKTES
jgi:putative protease